MTDSTAVIVRTETIGAVVHLTDVTPLGTVPIGPRGPAGDTGPRGEPGADSTVPGPAGPSNLFIQAGDPGEAGPLLWVQLVGPSDVALILRTP